jgi:hypothetical protein
MSRYGVAIYGKDFYGEPSLAIYSAAPFVATPQNYGVLRLTYTTPGGSWLKMRLLRNYQGYPVAQDDGLILFEVAPGDPMNYTYLDTGLPVGAWVYYSIFVFVEEDDEWVFCGSAESLAIKDFGGGQNLYDLMPRASKGLMLDSPGVNQDLLDFTDVFGFTFDILRNYAYSLLSLRNTLKVQYDLVPLQMQDFGIPEEFTLEPEQYRRWLTSAVFLYEIKGTEPCVRGVVSAVTGWDSTVAIGDNMFWTQMFSDFNGDIGTWCADNSNTEVELHPGYVFTDGAIIDTLRVTAIDEGDIVALMCPADQVLLVGIPLIPGRNLTLGALVSTTSVDVVAEAVQAFIGMDFYGPDGTYLSTWTNEFGNLRHNVLWDGIFTEAIPEGVAYGIPFFSSISTPAGASFDLTQFRLSYGNTLSTQTGRDIRITLDADRINIVKNSSFEVDDNGWTAAGGATQEVSPTKSAVGVQSLRLTAGVDGAGNTSTAVTTAPGARYGVQLALASGAAHDVTMETYAADSVGGTILEDVDTTPGSATQVLGAHADFNLDGVLPTFTFVADSPTTVLVVQFDGGGAADGDEVYIDAVIAELASGGTAEQWAAQDPQYVKGYFDGASASDEAEYFWQGEPYESESHFYYRRATHEGRLRAILPRYLPIDATFTLLYAQPAPYFFVNPDLILTVFEAESVASVSADLDLVWDVGGDVTSDLQLVWNVEA